MKVLLLKEVRGLGHAGEVKEVADGYARNFLIARGLANFATKHSLSVLGAQKNKRERVKKLEEKNKGKLAKKINGKVFAINAKADEKGTLYSKINTKYIVSELANQGVAVTEKELKLNETIKSIGQYEIDLVLSGESASIKLLVKNQI